MCCVCLCAVQFYLSDEIGEYQAGTGEQWFTVSGTLIARSAEQAVTILFVPVLLGALMSSLISGLISDWMGGKRKQLVYISGGIMCLAGLLFAFTRSYLWSLMLGGLFGLGFGAFSVMDWAMATDVLPNAEEFAKDMGLWSLAMVLPQVLAVPLSGLVLDFFRANDYQSMGYSLIFLLAALYFCIGTVFVNRLEGVD